MSLRHSVASFLTLQICRAPRTRLRALVLSLTCCHFCCPMLQRLSLPPIKVDRISLGGTYRHYSVMQAGRNVLHYSSSAFFFKEEECFSEHLCCRCCQPEDRHFGTGSVVVTARRATTSLSQSAIKTLQCITKSERILSRIQGKVARAAKHRFLAETEDE